MENHTGGVSVLSRRSSAAGRERGGWRRGGRVGVSRSRATVRLAARGGGRAAAACPHGGGRDAVGGRSQRQERQRYARIRRIRGVVAERDGTGANGERRIVRSWKGGA